MVAYITLRFDDGTISQYSEAYNWMKQFNLPGSIFIVGKHLLEDGKNYIKIGQLLEMQENGWEIGYHSYSHDKSWIDDPNRFEKETNTDFLEEMGFNIKNFALPHSAYNSDVLKYLGEHYKGILGLPSNTGNSMEYLPFYNFFRCYTITKEKTLKELTERIQEAVLNDEYLILLMHKIERRPKNLWSMPLKRFRQLIRVLDAYKKEELIKIQTLDDIFNKIAVLPASNA